MPHNVAMCSERKREGERERGREGERQRDRNTNRRADTDTQTGTTQRQDINKEAANKHTKAPEVLNVPAAVTTYLHPHTTRQVLRRWRRCRDSIWVVKRRLFRRLKQWTQPHSRTDAQTHTDTKTRCVITTKPPVETARDRDAKSDFVEPIVFVVGFGPTLQPSVLQVDDLGHGGGERRGQFPLTWLGVPAGPHFVSP